MRALTKADWNRFVASSPHGHVLQSWEWGQVREKTGWQTVRLPVRDAHGNLVAAAQVLVRSLPYGFGRLAYVPKGPVVDPLDRVKLHDVVAALSHVAAGADVVSLKVEPEALEAAEVERAFAGLNLTPSSPVQMRSTIWVDLGLDEDEIMARQKQKTRYNIRLAERKGVEIRSGSLDDLDAWYAMFRTTAKRDGFTIHPPNYYRVVLQELEPSGFARLLLAHHDGDLLAGIIVFCFGHKAQYMYGASSDQKRNLMAPYLLQWEGMRWAKAQGAAVYDLWGIPDRLEEGEELWGVYRHKRGYGGEVMRYVGAFDLVRDPVRHFALERMARPLFKRLARREI